MRQPRKVNKNLYKDSIEYDTNCTSITAEEWAKLMNRSERASGKLIRRMIKKQLPELYEELALMYPNPYESQCAKTVNHYIYVHSAIEYFLKRI